MKVIDRTPYFSADGKINMIEQAKASMKLGASWVQETQVQPGVMAALERELDKKYTLLRNVTLAGLDISIPFILVGPTGIYALYVTALRGLYRAKGDLWGTLSGDKFNPAPVNLLTRTNRMARAVQVYLQRQGYESLSPVESAILCADPGMHVDSVRPIVRVVQSDALERFAASIAQTHAIYSPETVAEVVNRLLNPKSDKKPEPAAAPVQEAVESTFAPVETGDPDPYVPYYALPESESDAAAQPVESNRLGFDFKDDDEVEAEAAQPVPAPAGKAPVQAKKRRRKGFSTRQWVVLILFGLVECALVIGLLYLVVLNP